MKPSELSWNLADYTAAGLEPPDRLRTNPELTEGAMMSADEVEEFIKDSIATLRILADKRSDRYDSVLATYKADLAYLVEIGSLNEADYAELIHESTTKFQLD